jgi:hypothetical protein
VRIQNLDILRGVNFLSRLVIWEAKPLQRNTIAGTANNVVHNKVWTASTIRKREMNLLTAYIRVSQLAPQMGRDVGRLFSDKPAGGERRQDGASERGSETPEAWHERAMVHPYTSGNASLG